MMSRECMAQALRNVARQRRISKRIFNDFNILINEGNYSDEVILENHEIEPRAGNTVCLQMSIMMTLTNMLRYLN
jgi:hypothetical protein